MSFEHKIVQTIKSVMPQNADVSLAPTTSAIVVGVSWPLNDDPARPNKRSKTISIHVSHEAAQDFANVAPHDHGACYARIQNYLSQKLRSFDPKHTASVHEAPPVEVWVITSEMVLGSAAG